VRILDVQGYGQDGIGPHIYGLAIQILHGCRSAHMMLVLDQRLQSRALVQDHDLFYRAVRTEDLPHYIRGDRDGRLVVGLKRDQDDPVAAGRPRSQTLVAREAHVNSAPSHLGLGVDVKIDHHDRAGKLLEFQQALILRLHHHDLVYFTERRS